MRRKNVDPLWHYSPVAEAKALGGYRVWLRFEDGLDGEIDLESELWGEIFALVRDPEFFARFTVDHTLCWPNGADISPEFLWDRVRFEKLGIPPPRSYVNGFPHSKPPTPRQLRAWREEDRAMSTGTPRRAARRKRRARK